MPKHLPPYGRQAAMHPDRHLVGLWIYTGKDAWKRAKAVKAPAMVLAEGESPDSFRWPVAGFATLIIRTSPIDAEVLLSLARALLRAGAITVTAIGSGPLVDFYAENRHAA